MGFLELKWEYKKVLNRNNRFIRKYRNFNTKQSKFNLIIGYLPKQQLKFIITIGYSLNKLTK